MCGNAVLCSLYIFLHCFYCLAGKTTTNDELEDMLESGNLQVFTQDVSIYISYTFSFYRSFVCIGTNSVN